MKVVSLGLFLLTAVAGNTANAGLYSDDMARCLVAKTSAADKTSLVRWIFANAALHPEVASIATITPEQRTGMDKAAGQLVERLLTVDCREQTTAALKYEGDMAMQLSFQVLGQVAMQELMAHQAVSAGFEVFTQYMDMSKIEQLQVK